MKQNYLKILQVAIYLAADSVLGSDLLFPRMDEIALEGSGERSARVLFALEKHHLRPRNTSGTVLSIRKAAMRYGGSKSLTYCQLASLRETGHELRSQRARGRPRALTTAEEDALIAYATTLFHGRFPAFASMLKDAANSLQALRTPSYGPVAKRWISRWLADHPELKLTTFRAIDIKRRIFKLNDISVNDFFDRLEAAITEKNISSSDIWNTDETGFRIGSVTSSNSIKIVMVRQVYLQKVSTTTLYSF